MAHSDRRRVTWETVRPVHRFRRACECSSGSYPCRGIDCSEARKVWMNLLTAVEVASDLPEFDHQRRPLGTEIGYNNSWPCDRVYALRCRLEERDEAERQSAAQAETIHAMRLEMERLRTRPAPGEQCTQTPEENSDWIRWVMGT